MGAKLRIDGGLVRADTGSFNKLLTSVGLLLMAAALVVPYFYFKNTDTFEIPAEELSGLTPVARSSIEHRQQAIADIETGVLIGSILVFVTGASPRLSVRPD